MNSLSEADIVDVLSKINDLSRGKDIYSLGIVTNIHIKDNNVQITLEVESHRANAFEIIRNKVEKSVRSLPNVSNCIVILTAHSEKSTNSSNNNDISASGDKLFLDVDKKFVSIEGDVEFSQGKSIIKAKKINVDLVTETVDFEGIKDSFIKN